MRPALEETTTPDPAVTNSASTGPAVTDRSAVVAEAQMDRNQTTDQPTDETARGRSLEARPLSDRALAWLLLVGGVVGFTAAFVLAVEKIALLTDPNYTPSCSLNPVLSIGEQMKIAE